MSELHERILESAAPLTAGLAMPGQIGSGIVADFFLCDTLN
jgi:hypothetical protein